MTSSAPTRRRVLAGVAGLGALGAGCLGLPDTADGDATTAAPTTSPADASSTDASSTDETQELPPDVDERVNAEPPGSPALEPSGAWPQPRFDAGNTAYNAAGSGLRDAEPHGGSTPAAPRLSMTAGSTTSTTATGSPRR